jgi:hypothetical protein
MYTATGLEKLLHILFFEIRLEIIFDPTVEKFIYSGTYTFSFVHQVAINYQFGYGMMLSLSAFE